MKNAKKTTDQAIQKYGKDNVSLTGHSLGGSQAGYVSRKTGLKSRGFNAAWSPIDLLRKRTYSNFTNHTSNGDPISALGRNVGRMNQVKVKSKSVNTHGLVNFI